MEERRRSLLPWMLAAGGAALVWSVWRRSRVPYYPEVALQAGLELLSRPRRVLAIGPHPDDLEQFVGGTLRLFSQQGSPVTMAVLSHGERSTNRANIAQIRAREAQQAAAALGADLIQLSLPDGSIRPGPELDQLLDQLWHRTDPEVVLTFDPKGPLPMGNNPDHLGLGAAVLNRVRRGMGGARVYCYATPQPNVLVDITEVLPEKMTAVQVHRSQLLGPDFLARPWVRLTSKLDGARTPAYNAEGLYRLV